MKPASRHHRCLVCGYPQLAEPPRSPAGGGSYEICPSCGYQYGFDDDDRGTSYEQHRADWVKGGMRWWSRGTPPPKGWDPGKQLSRVAGQG